MNLVFSLFWNFLLNINTTLFNLLNYVYIYINSFYINIIINLGVVAVYLQGLWWPFFYIFIFIFLKKHFFNFLLFFSGLLKIHPLLFYIGVIALICALLYNNHTSFYNNFLTLLTSLFLGSIWALYQNVWGYYWSNDSIELLLAFYTCVCLFHQHRKFSLRLTSALSLIIYNTFMLILLRLGYIYTKHNFFDTDAAGTAAHNNLFILYFLTVVFNLHKYEKKNQTPYLTELVIFMYIYVYSYNLINLFHVKVILLLFFFLSSLILLFNLSLQITAALAHHFLFISLTLVYLFSKNKYLIFMSYGYFFFSLFENNFYNFFLNNNKYVFFKLTLSAGVYNFKIDQLSLCFFNKSTLKNNIFIIF